MSATTRRGFLTGAGGAVLGGAAVLAAPAAAGASALARGAESRTGTTVVTPGDVRYPGLVRGANQRFTGSPDSVHVVTNTREVVQAVSWAVAGGKRVSVRSGGHCYEDFVANDQVRVLIEMSQMNQVFFDSTHSAFAVEAGASLLDVYHTLFKGWGLVVPAGSCPSVGAGGFIPNGGYGPLSRSLGLAVDHLYGVEVVTVDASGRARVVLATRDDDGDLGDLWWAHTGGGGGSFGIVTRYLFRSLDGAAPAGSLLPPPPSEVLVRTVVWPWDTLDEAGFARLVGNFGSWHTANSAPDSPGRHLFAQLKLVNRSAGAVAMSVQVDATVKDAQALIDGFVSEVSTGVGAPLGRPAMRRPWHHALLWQGFSPPDPTVMRFKIKSAYMRTAFPGDQVQALYRNLTLDDNTNEGTLVIVSSYGGRINAVDPAATATNARDSIMKLQYVALWQDQADDGANIGWVRGIYADVYSETGGVPVPNDVTDGCYIGYPDVDLGDPEWNGSDVPWNALYFGDNYARLRSAKAAWDPGDVFRHAQSIRLPD
ncbi:FAD-binding oxidoreductase [Nocardiopsis rhodophaea]|uniref:FAD-binding oxidoreductase n=1 Tax=Nocardiopsis rhodophaea TaxID=280238 RepID=A0ABN2S5H8_9ACTN